MGYLPLLAKMGCEVALSSDINPEQLLRQKLIADYAVIITVLDVSDKDAVYAWADSV
jgi:hypothetical protein